MYTLRTSYVFFSEESVEIEMSGAHFSDSEFSSKVKLIPGTFDIGKWVRPLDCTFVTKPGVKTLNINRGDDWGYVKFNTKEKIRLKKFHSSDRFMDLMESNIRTRTFKRLFPAPLSYYYKLYEESKMHKLILKEVKNNLMD
jgi:hypothetical protein